MEVKSTVLLVILSIFATVTCPFAASANPLQCNEYYSKPFYKHRTILDPFDRGEALIDELDSYFTKHAPYLSARKAEILKSSRKVLRHAIQNTFQHGSRELEAKDYKNAKVEMSSRISSDRDFIYIEISNPQIKPFPKSLIREFTSLDRISVPDDQRVGYTGSGIALRNLHYDMIGLPYSSSVKWEADGAFVTFTLKIAIW